MDWIDLLKADEAVWSPEARILYVQEEGFGSVTDRYTVLAAPTFAASVSAGSVADISTAVSTLH
jgi:hypothetical protein